MIPAAEPVTNHAPEAAVRRRLRRPHIEEVGLQIAPMVDVTLLLLFFFMLTGKLTQGQKLLQIKLPNAESSIVPQAMEGRVIVNVDDKGNILTGDQPTSLAQMKAYLKQRFINYPPLKLYIRADERTEAKLIKQVIAAGAEAGAIEVVFGVTKS